MQWQLDQLPSELRINLEHRKRFAATELHPFDVSPVGEKFRTCSTNAQLSVSINPA